MWLTHWCSHKIMNTQVNVYNIHATVFFMDLIISLHHYFHSIPSTVTFAFLKIHAHRTESLTLILHGNKQWAFKYLDCSSFIRIIMHLHHVVCKTRRILKEWDFTLQIYQASQWISHDFHMRTIKLSLLGCLSGRTTSKMIICAY